MAVTEPVCSSNSVWYDENPNRSVTDEVEAVKSNLADHTHTGYAAADHTHDYAAASHEHTNYALVEHTHDLTGKADLVNGKVPESQLPSYVDDVVEYANFAAFPATGESGKIYLDQDENKSYRWGGTTYVPIVGGVVLGETAATAHRGDHGAVAYAHSQDGTVHVTADQKTAWDAKAAGDHTHDTAYIAKALQFLNDLGGVEVSYTADSGVNMLTVIAAMAQGMHTAYFGAGLDGNPNTSESWRCILHKSAATFGWLLAFGSAGSVFTNYLDNGTWKGWHVIYDAAPAALWTGSWYMNAAQTVIPSKPLSECRNGWVLVWSDFDTSGNAAVNSEACTTVIPKRGLTGGKWTGQCFLTVLPAAVTESADSITIKRVQVYDAYLTGHAFNTVNPRNDIVLRAIYEY